VVAVQANPEDSVAAAAPEPKFAKNDRIRPVERVNPEINLQQPRVARTRSDRPVVAVQANPDRPVVVVQANPEISVAAAPESKLVKSDRIRPVERVNPEVNLEQTRVARTRPDRPVVAVQANPERSVVATAPEPKLVKNARIRAVERVNLEKLKDASPKQVETQEQPIVPLTRSDRKKVDLQANPEDSVAAAPEKVPEPERKISQIPVDDIQKEGDEAPRYRPAGSQPRYRPIK
jgi:hypothetical protein